MKVIRIGILIFLCFWKISIFHLQAQELPKPNPAQLAWQNAELGIIFHYDLHVFDGLAYKQSKNRITPIPDIKIFNPSKLDVEQWVISAKEAGAKFALITATHETGFALYPSKANPYNTLALGWKNGKEDLLGDFIKACHKHGLKPGVYIGIRWNSYLGVHDFVVDGEGEMQLQRQRYYNNMVEEMVKEICTWYGPLFEIWFDGGASHPEKGAPDVLPIVKKYQPECLFYHNDQLAEARWGGSESGTVNYPCWSNFPFHFTGSGESAPREIWKDGYKLLKTGDPNGKYFMPAMADAPLRGDNGRHEWFWEPNDEHSIYSLDKLVDIYHKSVGRNATLVLGVTPDTAGLVPHSDRKRMQEFGQHISNMYREPIVTSNQSKNQLTFKKQHPVKHIMLREDISEGQKIRSFRIQEQSNGKWTDIYQGSSIGNKHLIILENPVPTKVLRIIIDHAVGKPKLLTFNAYENLQNNP
ncbi:alpha-L-fucosidase [Sphingobacterium sp. 1.A.4]|uniref:alpha-L-fucosidase n=1 Tax=Sphingobacterium sp. 1.A.4 TaxID=2044603 RepID=UPI000C0C0F6A|nr:alpha-L-fucosidase [Sphingobacterium sp. 1.A.4]